MIFILCSLGLLSGGIGRAQDTFSDTVFVNGVAVAGASNNIVSDITYVPAYTYANALGASYMFDYGNQMVVMQFSNIILTLNSYKNPLTAGQDGQALKVDGQVVSATGAVDINGKVYVPAIAIAKALGGYGDIGADGQVTVLFNRAQVVNVSLASYGTYERLTLELTEATSVKTSQLDALDTIQFRLMRTDLPTGLQLRNDSNPVETDIGQFSGVLLRSGSIRSLNGNLDVNLKFAPGYSATMFTTQAANIAENSSSYIVIDVAATSSQPEGRLMGQNVETTAVVRNIVLDFGTQGAKNDFTQSNNANNSVMLTFLENIETSLNNQGHDVILTRSIATHMPIAQRSDKGIGRDLMISINSADLPANTVNIFYLGDAQYENTLDYAIFANAEELRTVDTDAVRRKVLLNLIPDLAFGGQYAQGLSRELLQNYSIRTQAIEPVPLAVLVGAAGRGVLIEVSNQDLLTVTKSQTLAETLATAIVSVLENISE